MSKILIETINLKKTYKHSNGNITLFNNLNFENQKGRTRSISWSIWIGKSSLLHSLALLDEPTRGDIKINDIFTKNLQTKKR